MWAPPVSRPFYPIRVATARRGELRDREVQQFAAQICPHQGSFVGPGECAAFRKPFSFNVEKGGDVLASQI
jgi:hypothetical protein